jgi:hypothetical protein
MSRDEDTARALWEFNNAQFFGRRDMTAVEREAFEKQMDTLSAMASGSRPMTMEAVPPHPFAEGECARNTGASEADNPYADGTWRHVAWRNGWLGLKGSAGREQQTGQDKPRVGFF